MHASMAVVIQATPSGSVPDALAGYCQTGQTTVTFTNQGMAGNPASSMITDLSLGIALGNGFSLAHGGFQIVSVKVAGISIPNISPMNSIANSPLFTTDPDGPGGLSDADGDGFFDDLAMGQSVEITATYTFDCGNAANADIGTNCLNNASTSLNARLQYTDNGQSLTYNLSNYLRPANDNLTIENLTEPDAFAGIDTFRITHKQSRRIRSFASNCSGNGQFVVDVTMPNGIVPVTDQFVLLKNGIDPVPFEGFQVNGSILTLRYDASFSTILSGEYTLEMVFTSTCFASLGESFVPIRFSHYCPTCDCTHIWYCGEVPGPHFHTLQPPCPGEVLVDCSTGIQARSFDVDRITFGFSDSQFLNPFDPAQANTKVALPCDKVSMRLVSTVGKTPVSDSLGVVIEYSNPNGSTNSTPLFLFENGDVRFTHGGNSFNCPIDVGFLTSTAIGADKTLLFNLDACVNALGFPLEEGDSIEFAAIFSIDPNGPVGTSFNRIPNFRAFSFATVNGSDISCDNFGETFWVGRGRAVYDFPNSSIGAPTGCTNGELHYRLFVPQNNFAGFFGNEFRQAQKIDSFVLDFNPAVLSAYSPAEVLVSIPDHPVFGDAYYNIRPLSDFPNGHYVAVFDTLNHVPSLNLVDEYSFDLKIILTPTCLAASNTSLPVQSKIYYRDRLHASTIGNGSCVVQTSAQGNSTVTYSKPAIIELTPLTPTQVTVQGGVAEWVLQVCNTSGSTPANIVWFSIEDQSGHLNVLSVEDITIPNNPQPLLLLPFGINDQYSFLSALAANDCIDLRLKANVDGCESLDFNFKTGWNCGAFPQQNWTPADNVCTEVSTVLGIENVIDSPVALEWVDFTSICQQGGEEVTFSAGITSTINIPSDNFTIRIYQDQDGNGQVEPSDTLLFSQTYAGSVNPVASFMVNGTFTAQAGYLCKLIATLETTVTDLCEQIMLPLPVPKLINAGADQFFCTLSGTSLTTVLGGTDCVNTDYTYSWTAVDPAIITALDDPGSSQPTLTLAWSDFLGESLSFVLETSRNGCNESTFDTIRLFLPPGPTGFFQNDTLLIQAMDCQSPEPFCTGIFQSEIADFEVFLNGNLIQASSFTLCNVDQVGVPLSIGTHELVLKEQASGCSDTIVIILTCTVTDNLDLSLLLNEQDTLCFDGFELPGEVVSVTNLCPDGAFVNYETFQDSCIVFTGELVGFESACFIACDAAGFCDTTYVNISVLHPFPNGLKDTIIISQVSEFCFEGNLLNIIGPIDTFENICLNASGGAVDFNLDPLNNCIIYEGLDIGTDTACIRVCDDLGNCDTVNYCVTVIPGTIVFDTVFISVDTNTYCIDGMLLPGNIISVEDICPENNAEQVFFEINGSCVSYYGTALGEDIACIRIEDEFGNVALINLVVTVVRTTPEVFCDTIFIGEKLEYCLDTFELPGIYQSFQIIYDDNIAENVSFEENLVSLCVQYEGLTLGRDSFAVALCDHFGFCDTTSFCITVVPYFDLPGLTEDSVYTFKETPIVIDPLSNDTVFGGLRDFFILDPPISGTATINLDGSITYIPDPPFCARWDVFTYVVCNPNGCDTTSINVYIECIELTIFNAVSPNNDNVNDYFYIAKIENFPNNRLWVYNRWGNQVFDSGSEGYQNNWPGTWGDEIDLPDGTYYYILEWSDNNVKTVQRGYFEMFR